MDFVLWFGINLRASVRDHANNRDPVLSIIEGDAAAYWITARPVAAGERLIDDPHRRRALDIAAEKRAPTQKRLAHGLEIILTSDQDEPRGARCICIQGLV